MRRNALSTELDLTLCLALAARIHPKRDNLRTALKKIARQFRAYEILFRLIERSSKPHLIIENALKDIDPCPAATPPST